MMDKEFIIIGKYILNRLDKGHFQKLLEKAIGHGLEDNYIDEKWHMFQANNLSFIVSYPELLKEAIKEVKDINYEQINYIR